MTTAEPTRSAQGEGLWRRARHTIRLTAEEATRRTTEEKPMNEVKRWTVDIDIDEHEGRTRAVARLHTRDTDHLVAAGTAHLSPAERDIPEIGDELAAARALSGLAHALLDAAVGDIDQIAGTPPARLRL